MQNYLTTTPNTILLKGRHHNKYEEGRVAAGKTIMPGMIIESVGVDSNGVTTYQPHATRGGWAELAVAVESVFTADASPGGADRGGTIDDAYQAGELVRFHICQPGDELYMLLKTANHALITSSLVSDGAGGLEIFSSTYNKLFKSLEDNNNSSGANARIRVRALGPN